MFIRGFERFQRHEIVSLFARSFTSRYVARNAHDRLLYRWNLPETSQGVGKKKSTHCCKRKKFCLNFGERAG